MLPRFVIFSALALSAPVQAQDKPPDVNRQISDLTAMVLKLQHRVDELEAKLATPGHSESTPAPGPQIVPAAPSPAEPSSNLLAGTSANFLFDGYYGYNFNNPIGRVNRLRSDDVLSNAFSINQADLVLENATDPARGKRWGLRLDLQFGQATETLQGNPANEPRPAIYRNIYQAYGTYIVPVGSGLTVDFGKWGSSLGIEGNYTQDQMNYSRSYWYQFLPFYHMGVRATYQFSPAIAASYWIVNGTQWVEPFNGFKDQFFGLILQPRKSISWKTNYYFGQEHPDFRFVLNGPGLPQLQGQPFEPIVPAADGKLHIFDTYATWQASPRWATALEGDYVISRLNPNSAPSRTWGGAAYVRYQLSRRLAFAARYEYLSDRGGLFSGATQILQEGTATFEQRLGEGFLMREEWRRDFSNQPYFYTDTLGVFANHQTTVTLGVVWWAGPKKGPW